MPSPPPVYPVVFVTGASRGLGRGIALELAAEGLSVGIHYAGNAVAAAETVALCESRAMHRGQRFVALQADIGVSAERARLMAECLEKMGRLDALVNNAGMAPRVRADITEATEESFEELMRVNLQGPYFLSQLAARYWLERPGESLLFGGYKLLFVTSVSATMPSVNRGEYCVSKAGLAMASQLWAARLAAHGVQVLELRPGIMATDMTAGVKGKYDNLIESGLVPQRRWGTPEDVGQAVRAICAGQFPFTTGDVIHLDGGLHLKTL